FRRHPAAQGDPPRAGDGRRDLAHRQVFGAAFHLPDGKAAITDPATGEALPSKKVRGSKAGGSIELIRVNDPQRLVLGEGIETVLSVWQALGSLSRDLSLTAFWSSADLGNLGGRSAIPVEHPSLKTA